MDKFKRIIKLSKAIMFENVKYHLEACYIEHYCKRSESCPLKMRIFCRKKICKKNEYIIRLKCFGGFWWM